MSLLRLIVLGILILATPLVASAEDADNSLLLYAVSINQSEAKGRSGTGIYLGKGLVLTASHVVGEALINRPHVTIAGQDLPARAVKQDTFERSDLALLAIDEGSLHHDGDETFAKWRFAYAMARPRIFARCAARSDSNATSPSIL